MRDRIDLQRHLVALHHHIADAANGADLDLCTNVQELFAQTMYINLDGIGGDISGQAEDLIFEKLLGNDVALAAQKQLKHRDLSGG